MPDNKQREFQKLVTTLATQFINLPPAQFDSGIDRMLEQIGQFIGADRAYIYHFSDDLMIASMQYEWCSPRTSGDIENEQNIQTQHFSVVFEKFKRGEADFIPRVLELPESRAEEKRRLIERGIKARITLPLFADDSLKGSMGFHTMQSEPDWADYTVDLLKIVGEIYLSLQKRRLVENQLHYQASLLQNVTDIVIACDLKLKVTSWNHAAEDLFGFTSAQAIGKSLDEVVKSEYSDLSRGDIIRAFIKDHKWQGELRHYDRDGVAIDLWVVVSAMKDIHGDMIGAVYIYRDLNQRKEAERQKLELRVQAERIELLEQIISDLSHDIKTPLASIQLLMYMLDKNKDIAKQTQYLERMSRQIARLTRLVDDILTMSRLDKGQELVFARVNLNQVLQELADSFTDILANKKQDLILDLSPDLPYIQGNETELNRALSNLIENAINYSADSKSIFIKSRLENESIYVEIRDEGDGIFPQDLGHIFERFYRADKARNTDRGGTGLGLAIVLRIIELHQAEIDVQSQIDEGTTVSIRFPPVDSAKS